MSRTNIILTGFMGCGKTTVGRLLAEELDYDFTDTDQLIEERFKMTVQEIFATKGEKAFREMESEIARELGGQDGLVISTGGGMMLNAHNVAALSGNGPVFCLVATPEEIFKRISSDRKNNRPLLDTSNPLERISQLIKDREQSYRQFTQINTSGKNPQEITQGLIASLQSLQNK
jgi:shikimate kinase